MNILIIDHDPDIRRTLGQALHTLGHHVETVGNAQEASRKLNDPPCHAVFLNVRPEDPKGFASLRSLLNVSPRLPGIVTTAQSSVELAVQSIREGAFDYLPKPFRPSQITQLLDRISKSHELPPRPMAERAMPPSDSDFASTEKAVIDMLEVAKKSAASLATILIQGESGSGKSTLAKQVHHLSERSEQPFVTVNCLSPAAGTFEKELFGQAQGTTDGVAGNPGGKLAEAEGGTLFLDEIGELLLELQPRLLRLIQEREYERVGESTIRTANIRIIASSTGDLRKAVATGAFREDLLYQLDAITLQAPPLRERVKDNIPLSEHFLHLFASQSGKTITGFTEAAQTSLRRYPWPGNIRELRNFIERAVILSSRELIDVEDLPSSVTDIRPVRPVLGGDFSTQEIEVEHIRQVLNRSESIQQASSILKIDPTTLLRKRKAFHLPSKKAT